MRVVFASLETAHFTYVVKQGSRFHQAQIESAAVLIKAFAEKERNLRDQEAVPLNMWRHLKVLEQIHTFCARQNVHFYYRELLSMTTRHQRNAARGRLYARTAMGCNQFKRARDDKGRSSLHSIRWENEQSLHDTYTIKSRRAKEKEQ
jgi:hypothetical protein